MLTYWMNIRIWYHISKKKTTRIRNWEVVVNAVKSLHFLYRWKSTKGGEDEAVRGGCKVYRPGGHRQDVSVLFALKAGFSELVLYLEQI